MLPVSIEMEAWNFDEYTRAFQRQALKEGLRAAGLFWHEEFAPRHFESNAPAKYGYQTRKKSRSRAWGGEGKRGVVGGVLQYTGQLKRMFLAGATVKVVGNRVIVRGQAPEYIQINRRKGTNYPDIKRELTTVTEGEHEVLAGVLRARAVEWLNNEGRAGIRRNKKGAGRPRGS